MFKWRKLQFLGIGLLLTSIITTSQYLDFSKRNVARNFIIYFNDDVPSLDGNATIAKINRHLIENPYYTIKIVGHSPNNIDKNKALEDSKKRASYVSEKIVAKNGWMLSNYKGCTLKIDGVGGSQPLPVVSIETPKAYQERLARVEVMLVREKC